MTAAHLVEEIVSGMVVLLLVQGMVQRRREEGHLPLDDPTIEVLRAMRGGDRMAI